MRVWGPCSTPGLKPSVSSGWDGVLLSLPCPEPLALSAARAHDVHTWSACRAATRPKTGDVTSRHFAPTTRSPSGCSDSFSGRPPAKRSGLGVRPRHGTRHGGRRELLGCKAGCGRPCAWTARTSLTAATPHSPAQHGPRRDRKCVTDQSRPSRVALPLGGAPLGLCCSPLSNGAQALAQGLSVGSDARGRYSRGPGQPPLRERPPQLVVLVKLQVPAGELCQFSASQAGGTAVHFKNKCYIMSCEPAGLSSQLFWKLQLEM